MYARSVLITGCSRGLGLELIRQLVSSVEILIATCRKPEEATELREFAAQHSNVKILALDVKAFDSFENVAQQVSVIVGNKGLNVLINNAGVLPAASREIPFYTEDFAETYEVNVIAPTKLTKALLPLLKQAGAATCDGDFHVKKSLVVNVSSILGSIGSMNMSNYLPYNCSKAALNMVTKCLSCELEQYGISVISMHPGWVKTDMGTSAATLTKEESMSLFVKTLGKITPEQTGQFFDWKGDKLPW